MTDLRRLFDRQDGLCAICRGPMCWIEHAPNQATRDHKVPRSRGGSNALTNLRAACKRCNEQRGDTWWIGDRQEMKASQRAAIVADAIRRGSGVGVR